MSCFNGLASDPTVCGVLNGWTDYITGNIGITMFLIFILLVVIGMIFRINTFVILIFMIPFSLLLLAFIGGGIGGVILILMGLGVAYFFSIIKR